MHRCTILGPLFPLLLSNIILFTTCRNCLDDIDSLYTGKIIRSRPVKADHVPIIPIIRAELPFQVMNMDCIGPLNHPLHRDIDIVCVLRIAALGGQLCML